MAYVVHKHTLDINTSGDVEEVLLPIDSEPLCAKNQRGCLCVWYRCDPSVVAKTKFEFCAVGTGRPCPTTSEAEYLDTVLFEDGWVVVHVFYRKVS